ncbi:MAG: hypothetical protein L3J20_11615, partial [Flavobacteriaceae bacterium]|nr:hypothetical protein [Flavobacteriaceae bacterium]
ESFTVKSTDSHYILNINFSKKIKLGSCFLRKLKKSIFRTRLNSLRNDLRNQLGLDKIDGNVFHLRTERQ